jgi:hypothetical protein
VHVKRLACVFLLQGCLCTGDPTYPLAQMTPPIVNSTEPDIFAVLDGGMRALLLSSQTISIHFSEPMDPNSLRSGIAVLSSGMEVPLDVAAPPHVPSYSNPNVNPANPSEFVVRVSAATGDFPSGTNVLLLRTLLIDDYGVPLAAEQSAAFDVQ